MRRIIRKKNEKAYGGRGNHLSSGGRLLSSRSLGGEGRLGSGLNNLDFLSGSNNGGLSSRHYCKKCECELWRRLGGREKGVIEDEHEKTINDKREKSVLRSAGPLAREK